MQIGNVPTPDCLSTFGLLGAELSCSTLHFALPLPVTALFQPGGGAPAFASSKLIVSASAVPDTKPAQIISVYIVFIVGIVKCFLASFVTELLTAALPRRRCTYAGQAGGQERALDCFGQFFGRTFAPVVKKQNARLLVRHVRVNRDDVNPADAHRFERGLQFVFSHSEISVDQSVVVTTGKGHPRVHAHGVVDLDAMHCRRMTDREFHHAAVSLAAHAEDFV